MLVWLIKRWYNYRNGEVDSVLNRLKRKEITRDNNEWHNIKWLDLRIARDKSMARLEEKN